MSLSSRIHLCDRTLPSEFKISQFTSTLRHVGPPVLNYLNLPSFNFGVMMACSDKWILLKYHSTIVTPVITARAPCFFIPWHSKFLPHWTVTHKLFPYPLNILQQLKDSTIITSKNLLLYVIAQQQRMYTKRYSRLNSDTLQQSIFLKLVLQPWLNRKRKAKCFHHCFSSPRIWKQLSRL